MPHSSDVNNRSEWNESKRKGTIDTRDTLSSIIKDEPIITDDSDFTDVCIKDEDSLCSQNNVGDIEDITINSGEANGESFIEICDSDARKTMSTNSPINHSSNDKKVSEYSQLCLKCGIATNESMNHTELCEATKFFICSACSFKCCSKNNLEYHMQNDHKIPMKCAVTLDSKEEEMSKSINNFLKERSPLRFSKIDRKEEIQLYCGKCHNLSRPTILNKREICGLCNTCLTYQCKLCKKRYTHPHSMYRHLKNECVNIEPQYECSQCDYKAKQKAHLRSHINLKHSIKKCTECGKNFKDFFALNKHQLHKCSNKPMFKCYCCSYKTIFKMQLKEHIRLEHNSRYTCSQCGKKYIHLKRFNNHRKNLCGFDLYFECNHCSYSTNFKSNLKVHITGQHSEIFLFRDSL